MSRKILLTGPESSGKTSLGILLAEELNGLFVPEYARTFLEDTAGFYVESDLADIAEGQLLQEDQATSQGADWVIVDTGMLVMKIWSQHKYQQVDPFIKEQLRARYYDAVILCKPDFPWEDDPLRENPEDGEFFFKWFERELKVLEWNYMVAEGPLEKRLQNCLDFVSTI